MTHGNAKYLSLIASITLLHQYQRKRVELAPDQLAIESSVEDVDLANRLVSDRVVPIGERALSWIEKWTNDVRPDLVTHSSNQALFVTKTGRRLHPNGMSNRVRRYMERVGVTHRGACHLFRHTAATLMMENGADLRSLQNDSS